MALNRPSVTFSYKRWEKAEDICPLPCIAWMRVRDLLRRSETSASQGESGVEGSSTAKRPGLSPRPHEFDIVPSDHEHPLVPPQVSHLRQVPLRTIV